MKDGAGGLGGVWGGGIKRYVYKRPIFLLCCWHGRDCVAWACMAVGGALDDGMKGVLTPMDILTQSQSQSSNTDFETHFTGHEDDWSCPNGCGDSSVEIFLQSRNSITVRL